MCCFSKYFCQSIDIVICKSNIVGFLFLQMQYYIAGKWIVRRIRSDKWSKRKPCVCTFTYTCIGVLLLNINPECTQSQKNLTPSYTAANSYYNHVRVMKLMPFFHSSLCFLAHHHHKAQILKDCAVVYTFQMFSILGSFS